MCTVQNNRIRVTVTPEIWESFLNKAQRCAAMSGESVEQAHRGLILSNAMSILGSKSEIARLERQPLEISDIDAVPLATRKLMHDYLESRGVNDIDGMLARADAGRPMGPSSRQLYDEAQAYAAGHLDPLTKKEICAWFSENIDVLAEGPESRHKLKILRLQLGDNTGAGATAIRWAREALQRHAETERRYREAHAQSDGWTIEIIGDMPAEIGLCAYDPATHHPK